MKTIIVQTDDRRRVVRIDDAGAASYAAAEDMLPEAAVAQLDTAHAALASRWMPGEYVKVGARRAYGDTLYECQQAHTTQADWTPDVTPALWLVVSNGEGWLAWVAYATGQQVAYGGVTYTCLQGHTAQPGWEPDATPALWAVVAEEPTTDEWAVGVAYKVGDVVTYGGAEYECRQSHTAQVGWEPPKVLSLWLPL